MKVIAKGKEEVLKHLESEAQARTGKVGEYMLAQDDAGNLVAVIAGRSFIGTCSMSLAGNRLVVVDGIVINIQQPQ